MNDLIEEIYHIVEENLDSAFRVDPRYKRCRDKTERLWDQIAADLGQEGNARLNDFTNALTDEDGFWRRAMFRRTLALGIALGRLEGQSSF